MLLCDEVGRDKAWVLAHPEYELQESDLKKLSTKIVQRKQHIPLAYIRGIAEFYGREFYVNRHVLIPRPESESIIEQLLIFASPLSTPDIIDVGSGSGALAITAKLEYPGARVFATDIDGECLKIARQNAKTLQAIIDFRQGDLLEPLRQDPVPKSTAIILANLPYVPADYPINAAARHEPQLALFSGSDGLDHYRRLFAAQDFPAPRTMIITEALPFQHQPLARIAHDAGFRTAAVQGLVQVFRRTVGASPGETHI